MRRVTLQSRIILQLMYVNSIYLRVGIKASASFFDDYDDKRQNLIKKLGLGGVPNPNFNYKTNLIRRHTVAVNLVVTDYIAVLTAAIARVTLDGIGSGVSAICEALLHPVVRHKRTMRKRTAILDFIRFTPFDYILPDENCSDKDAF